MGRTVCGLKPVKAAFACIRRSEPVIGGASYCNSDLCHQDAASQGQQISQPILTFSPWQSCQISMHEQDFSRKTCEKRRLKANVEIAHKPSAISNQQIFRQPRTMLLSTGECRFSVLRDICGDPTEDSDTHFAWAIRAPFSRLFGPSNEQIVSRNSGLKTFHRVPCGQPLRTHHPDLAAISEISGSSLTGCRWRYHLGSHRRGGTAQTY